MKRLWPVLLVMFMLCAWSVPALADTISADTEISNIVIADRPDILVVDSEVTDPMNFHESIGAYLAPWTSPAITKTVLKSWRCCNSTVASFIDNTMAASKLTNTTIYAALDIEKPGYHLTL